MTGGLVLTEKFNELMTFLDGHAIPYKKDEPMSKHTTFLVGGAAPVFIEPTSAEQIADVQRKCDWLNLPLFTLGRGSNLLVGDDALPMAVLHLGDNFAKTLREKNALHVAAGTKLSQICTFARDNSLTGLEFAYGIPGTLGGAIYMNAGAYGGEMCNVVTSVTFLNEQGKLETFGNEELDFSYRHSYFTGKKCIILSAILELKAGEKESISAAMEDYMSRRRDKQPLEFGSAGSTFKRPKGAFASALIDDCKLKGRSVGGAQVSEKHAGFIINRGGATAADIHALMQIVKETVLTEKGYTLEPEVMILP